ncbi:MAG: Ig-like domain-containing protein [Novosphingobium sp.]
MDEFCPRQVTFYLPGNPAVKVIATEDNGKIVFKVDAQGDADLRGFFFDVADTKEAGLKVVSSGGYLTEWRAGHNAIIDLDDGANMAGAVKKPYDIGLEWGTPGTKKDNINFEVTFTLDNTAHNLTLDDIAFQRFGAKLDSVGAGSGGGTTQSSKLVGVAPAAPNANADTYNIFEDGAANASSPSKDPHAVTLNVLANDTDADNVSTLKITEIHDGPAHGTVTIAADGKTLLYTPDLDWSGTDTFLYCVKDADGNEDNALVTVNVSAVADDPVINWSIAQGSDINEILITVTATQNDADGSEFIDLIQASVPGGLPAGSTVTPGTVNPGTTPGSITQVFTVVTPPGQDVNFNLDFTAVSKEFSNGDTESETKTQKIEIDFTHNQETLTYQVVDQSIWSTGDEFVFDLHKFLGVDYHDSGGDSFDVLGVTVAGYEYELGIKAGFQLDVHFNGGGIDATVPVDITVDSTFNKTTDTIYLTSASALGTGGSFTTTGPEGYVNLDFIFKYIAYFSAFSDIFPDINIGPFSADFSQNLIDLNTADPAYHLNLFGGVVDVALEWPHISVTNDPGLMSGDGASNNFLQATLDVDALANYLLGGALSFIDSDPTTEDNFELLDLDIVGGLNVLQEFAIALQSQTVDLILEDGAHIAMTLGTALTIANASSHDVNHDGHIDMSFDFTPLLELHNKTEIGGNMSVELALVRNLDLGVTDVTVYDESFPIVSGPIATVYEDTFTLNTDAIVSQTMTFQA